MLFCDHTPHRKLLLESVQKKFPGSHIIGIMASNVNLERMEIELIGETILLNTSRLFLLFRDKNLWYLRKKHIDLLILPFDGFRYRMVAAVLKPEKCEAWTGYLQTISIPTTALAGNFHLLISRVNGLMQLLSVFGSCVATSIKHNILYNSTGRIY